ncbi:MAG: hypothetical protein A2509_00665 [Candidatus Edwardsbacteria bacterium RIFOXYD12_FULL_50_11]|uniref:Secretion system C-terminal sorting domain-containing protein n=1 Tax=Candidatus Edwardsbacteria bacterium GWF2_54_11 TaxID=1817851 RepID=A0A1F5RD86_9BACT|nr:MAG: hypothetical protein A2502_07810 [Candidatus Edwardsbacteria bacterium RifOxyC12_full_54_24]OGF07498.1 MAG: hypothetical protein A2273_03250 [Candidatus Edwardsbacteria bacterium RifOxyA12_full_54_48]OGF09748.1 MAG: hypothetical protein A3K15_09660 [Candidatus Edwardsbacteria bacterium GWE2_54_12]OGF12011.1 MAG: hypothetical protein A2024_03215 [Candidatus Edwardsbacteria bacterium GWF2_54_11]OGF16109.1 MAG: hypothetical protein A2509_00665 [Candidatus Edwardsbacteria bacterium RIFOXYD1
MFKKIYLSFLLVASFSGLAYASADSLRMRTVSSWPYSINAATAAATINGHDYLLAGMGGGIFIFNIDSLDAPYKVSEAATQASYIKDIAVAGDYAYLAASDCGLWILDISDPLNPYVTGNVDLPGYAVQVRINNNHAFVASCFSGVRIANISDPYNPYEAGYLDNGDYFYGLDVNDTLLYTAGMTNGLKIYNISSPAMPVEIGYNDSTSDLRCVYYKGGYLYGGNTAETVIFDVSDPTNPVITGTGGYGAYRMAILDTIIYGTINSYFYSTINISDPSSPVLVETNPTDWFATFVTIFKNRLIVTTEKYFSLQDITDPVNPVETYRFDCPVIYGTGAVKDSFAYMPSDYIHIIKTTETQYLQEVSSVKSIASGFSSICIKDSLAYLPDFIYGLQVINIADPYNPIVLDSVYCAGFCNYVAITDSFALLTQYNNIKVINVSDPSNIFVVDSFITNDIAYNICIDGSLAYLANSGYGLRIYDITNLPAITEIGYYDTPGTALYVAVQNGMAYVADGDSGMRIINVSESTTPVELGHFVIPNPEDMFYGANSLAVKDSLVYISYDTLGVRVVNVSDPANPTESGYYKKIPWSSYNFGCSANGLTLADNKVYVSYYQYGLQVFEYTSPSGVTNNKNESRISSFLLKEAYPNPARGKATISYQLPAKSTVSLNVYNVAGRLVQSVNMGTQLPGYYNIPLKTDKLSSGVYFYKLTAGSNSQTKKLVILK